MLEVDGEMHEIVIDKDATIILTTIKLDDRRNKLLSMAGSVKAVKEKLF